MLEDIAVARRAGARLPAACEIVGISLRTYRRWQQGGEDGRALAQRAAPAHTLTLCVNLSLDTPCLS